MQVLVKKEYQNPRFGDAIKAFKHPSYLPFHPAKRSEIDLKQYDFNRVPLSNRLVSSLQPSQLQQEFHHKLDKEAEKGFTARGLKNLYKEELDAESKKI